MIRAVRFAWMLFLVTSTVLFDVVVVVTWRIVVVLVTVLVG